MPDVEVVWVRDSTGVITARFLAEKDNPRADMVLGLAAIEPAAVREGRPARDLQAGGRRALKPVFRDSKRALHLDRHGRLSRRRSASTPPKPARPSITTPTSWKDLLDPSYKGKLVMPHPASSGTGYLMVAAWLQTMGEAEGWKFMDALHENIAVYTHSGSRALRAGRARASASPASRSTCAAPREKTKGAPLEVIIPAEGIGWEMEAIAIVKGTKNLDARQEGRRLGGDQGRQRALLQDLRGRGASGRREHARRTIRPMPRSCMIKNDFAWMAENRERILAEWSKRYESKAAPKN